MTEPEGERHPGCAFVVPGPPGCFFSPLWMTLLPLSVKTSVCPLRGEFCHITSSLQYRRSLLHTRRATLSVRRASLMTERLRSPSGPSQGKTDLTVGRRRYGVPRHPRTFPVAPVGLDNTLQTVLGLESVGSQGVGSESTGSESVSPLSRSAAEKVLAGRLDLRPGSPDGPLCTLRGVSGRTV